MTDLPEDLRYTPEHEWVRQVGPARVRVGITDFAQEQLGDIVYVQLPDADAQVATGDAIAEVESTKSVSEIYAPLSAKVAAVNELLSSAPETVNSDPYGEGWMFELELGDAAAALAGLLDSTGYQGVIGA